MDETVKTIGWTKPNQIDGSPDEVREQVINQLRDVARSVGELVDESGKQIRSADLSIILSKSGPKSGKNAVLEWEESEQGKLVSELRRATAGFLRAVAKLA